MVNGLAAPDGRIFLTRGFYEKYRRGEVTAEELASVIAHELGHVALGHTRRRMIDFSGQNAIRVALASVLGRILPGLGVWIANMLTTLSGRTGGAEPSGRIRGRRLCLRAAGEIGDRHGAAKSPVFQARGADGHGRARHAGLADEPPPKARNASRRSRRWRRAGRANCPGTSGSARGPAAAGRARFSRSLSGSAAPDRRSASAWTSRTTPSITASGRDASSPSKNGSGCTATRPRGRKLPFAGSRARFIGDDASAPAARRRGQNVDIRGVGQPERGLVGGRVLHPGPGEAGGKARGLATRKRGVPRPALPPGGAHPFLGDPRRPCGPPYRPRFRATDQDLAQDGGIEHAGVENPDRFPGHGISRKPSTLR